MVLKERIINCFNSKACSYDAAADIQPAVALRLADKLSGVAASSILEIGCGTGLFSQYLCQHFPNADLLLTDIAPAMVSACQQRFASNNSKVTVKCLDGEHLGDIQTFDLITSSMTVHWFSAMQESLLNIISKLNPGGRFVFAMLGRNSLSEWRHFCHEHQASIPTPTFPMLQEIQMMFPEMELQVELSKQHYPSAHDFLKTLKEIGANAPVASHVPLSSGMLRRIMRALDASTSHDIAITYEIIYGSYIKK